MLVTWVKTLYRQYPPHVSDYRDWRPASRTSTYLLGMRKGVLPKSHQAFKVAATRPSGLVNLVFTRQSSLRASSFGRSGGGAGKGRRTCNHVPGIWIPPPIPLWLPVDWTVRLPPVSAKQETSANVNKHWKTCAKDNDVITNVLSINQHLASTFLMQIFKFQT